MTTLEDITKVLSQTVRDLKREVNKTILKVPEVEQKALDATSNEPWGPHGTLMSELALASRNHHEFQMIMAVLWKRLQDSGKYWRHVYKALTVMEFLVAHGSERVIDELRESMYQIKLCTKFDYIEPSGKDQGINVRKKAETLLALIKDNEKIREVRHKAKSNKDKYGGYSSSNAKSFGSGGGSFRSGRYDDDEGYGGKRDTEDHRGGSAGKYGDSERPGRYGDYSGKYDSKDGGDYDARGPKYGASDEYTAKYDTSDRRKQYDERYHYDEREEVDDMPDPRGHQNTKPGYSSVKPGYGQPGSAEEDFDDFDPRGSVPAPKETKRVPQDTPVPLPVPLPVPHAAVPKPVPVTVPVKPQPVPVDLFGDDLGFKQAPPPPQPLVNLFDAPQPVPPPAPVPGPAASFGTFQEASGDNFGFSAFTSAPVAQPAPTVVPPSVPPLVDPFFASFSAPAVEPSLSAAAPGPVSQSLGTKRDPFEPKSKFWVDALSTGLVDLNIGNTTPRAGHSLKDLGIETPKTLAVAQQAAEKRAEEAAGKRNPAMAAMGPGMGRAIGKGSPGGAGSPGIGGSSQFGGFQGTGFVSGADQFGVFK